MTVRKLNENLVRSNVMLHVDDLERFKALFFPVPGVSAAIRALMRQHLDRVEQSPELRTSTVDSIEIEGDIA